MEINDTTCADGDMIETVFRTLISVNLLSIYGADSDVCEEYSTCRIRTERPVLAVNSTFHTSHFLVDSHLTTRTCAAQAQVWRAQRTIHIISCVIFMRSCCVFDSPRLFFLLSILSLIVLFIFLVFTFLP